MISPLENDLDLDTFLDALEAIRNGQDPTPYLLRGTTPAPDELAELAERDGQLWY